MVFIDPDGVQRKKSGLGPQLVNVKKKKKEDRDHGSGYNCL